MMAAQSKIQAFTDFIRFLLFKSPKFRKSVMFAIIAYVALKILKRKYHQKYDKVKYVTVEQVLSSKKEYDFIVIGSGTSGSCVAGLLSRDARRPNVLLIEAGAADSYHPLSEEVCPAMVRCAQKNSKDWQYSTVPQKNGLASMKEQMSNWPRGKICGGSSITNYMVYVRGNKEDYNEWEEKYNCKGWSWNEIVPIFKSLEKCLFDVKSSAVTRGLDGLQPLSKRRHTEQSAIAKLFVGAAISCGYTFNDNYNGSEQDGVSYTEYTIDENGRRATSYRSFVASLFDKHNKYNIDVLPNSQVTKILTKKVDNMHIAQAVRINSQFDIFVKDTGHIVVCCGAVGSPHLLMLSGIGPKQELDKHGIDVVCDAVGVGQNLRDHVMQGFKVYVGPNKGSLYSDGAIDGLHKLAAYLWSGSSSVLSTTGLDAQIFTQSDVAKKNKKKGNDLQLVNIAIGDPKDEEQTAESGARFFNYDMEKEDFTRWKFKDKQFEYKDIAHSIVATIMNVRPKSVGSITLKSSDPYDHPHIDPNYLSNVEDKQVLMDGWRKMVDIYSSETFQKAGCKIMEYERFKDMEQMGDWVFDNLLLTIYHPVGTCKMGDIEQDKMAVCTERCRVKGFNNLSVMDASCAPDLVAGNTQAMCYLIGCKGAKMILEDWKP